MAIPRVSLGLLAGVLMLTGCRRMEPEMGTATLSPAAASARMPVVSGKGDSSQGEESMQKDEQAHSMPTTIGRRTIQPPVPPAEAPPPSERLPLPKAIESIEQHMVSYFRDHEGRRLYIQIDKPIYKPGETIWIRTWDLKTADFSGEGISRGLDYSLISPKGAVVLSKRVREENGRAINDFILPEGIPGGEYTLRVATFDHHEEERPILVSAYEAPRIKKKLEFLRKAYGAGDQVGATIELKRPTGEALGSHPVEGVVWLDGREISRLHLQTNADGGAVVRFQLPETIQRGDGRLTLLVEDGGVTESISKEIPIVLKKIQLSFYPEGGRMVEGLPTRLYFEALNPLGKPADVEGRIVDDHGNPVASFSSYDRGLGRIAFMPSTGRRYHATITRPAGILETYPLPLPEQEGCVLKTFDDYDGVLDAIRVEVSCTRARKVLVHAMLRERTLDVAGVNVSPGHPAVVYLAPKDAAMKDAQGVTRITLFDDGLNPLAERLVYRKRRARLDVEVSTDKETYAPRDKVTLTIKTSSPSGAPVPADLAVSVVDDTVVSFADDKTGHILSRLYLEPEIPGTVEEPNFYFDLTEEHSARAMDLLMGTKGWRTFEWRKVLDYARPRRLASGFGDAERFAVFGAAVDELRMEAPAAPMDDVMALQEPAPPAPLVAKRKGARVVPPARELERAAADIPPLAAPPRRRARRNPADEIMPEEKAVEQIIDRDWIRRAKPMRPARGWAPVRVFPAPVYSARSDKSPRTDFRETIHWAPKVSTGTDGTASLSFYLSDAVTTFRIFTEGVAHGAAGRSEKVIESSLPFSMAVKLPLEVSQGDRIECPLTLSNRRDDASILRLETAFGEGLTPESPPPSGDIRIEADSNFSVFLPLRVGPAPKEGRTSLRFAARGDGLRDEFVRALSVVPRGFPFESARSGVLKEKAIETFELPTFEPGSLRASLSIYASPAAGLVGGLDGMLRQPTGCFEQASSSNYPNIMIMSYLQEEGTPDVALVSRSKTLLEEGYRKLIGYETSEKGYEWFGGTPAHEALSAYGLLEFVDMKKVYAGVDDEMVARTADWLMSRRDGKGGFKRSERALDSFGRAGAEVTDAYITYSLVSAGFRDLQPELERQRALAETSTDPYLLALAGSSLLQVDAFRRAGHNAAAKLARMQKHDGRWSGAAESITRSGGQSLEVETTALATLTLLEAGTFPEQVRKGVEWLQSTRSGGGAWGSTQATVLALKALTRYAEESKKMRGSGRVSLRINGAPVQTLSYEAGRAEPLVFDGLETYLTRPSSRIEIVHEGKGELPYSLDFSWYSAEPDSSPNAPIALETALERDIIPMGENVRMRVRIRNRRPEGVPMTIARIGIPGGLTFQNRQLKALREQGAIAFYETRPREVILYFRAMAPNESKEIPIDLIATVPGRYAAPPSSAYLYYTSEDKTWVEGVEVVVSR